MRNFNWWVLAAGLAAAAPMPHKVVPAIHEQAMSVPASFKPRLHKRIIILATNFGLGLGSVIGNAAGSGVGGALSDATSSITDMFNGVAVPTSISNSDGSNDEILTALQDAVANPQPGPLSLVGGTVGEWFGAEVGKFLTEGLDGSADVPVLLDFIGKAAG